MAAIREPLGQQARAPRTIGAPVGRQRLADGQQPDAHFVPFVSGHTEGPHPHLER
jgi:hypothetical protein